MTCVIEGFPLEGATSEGDKKKQNKLFTATTTA